jgi:hypothetical protein
MKASDISQKSNEDAKLKPQRVAEEISAVRRPYCRPRITTHGPIACIALGGSPGVGDSGSEFIQRPPGG